jgi:hypothetical protein
MKINSLERKISPVLDTFTLSNTDDIFILAQFIE